LTKETTNYEDQQRVPSSRNPYPSWLLTQTLLH